MAEPQDLVSIVTPAYKAARYVGDAIRSVIANSLNNAMSASFTPIDGDGNPNGEITTETGLFKGPQWPKGDASSTNPMMFGLVMECDV